MFPYLSIDLVWLLRKSKEGDGFQGWHKDFSLGQQITKTNVINVGSKERDNDKTTRSFDKDVSFEGDGWKEIEEYALSGLNSEDKLTVVNRLDMYRTHVLIYHTMVFLARLIKVSC
jgi:hypothetical protein